MKKVFIILFVMISFGVSIESYVVNNNGFSNACSYEINSWPKNKSCTKSIQGTTFVKNRDVSDNEQPWGCCNVRIEGDDKCLPFGKEMRKKTTDNGLSYPNVKIWMGSKDCGKTQEPNYANDSESARSTNSNPAKGIAVTEQGDKVYLPLPGVYLPGVSPPGVSPSGVSPLG